MHNKTQQKPSNSTTKTQILIAIRTLTFARNLRQSSYGKMHVLTRGVKLFGHFPGGHPFQCYSNTLNYVFSLWLLPLKCWPKFILEFSGHGINYEGSKCFKTNFNPQKYVPWTRMQFYQENFTYPSTVQTIAMIFYFYFYFFGEFAQLISLKQQSAGIFRIC